MKELNILSRTEVGPNLYLRDSEDESDAKIFRVPALKLASNQLHTSSSNWCQGSHNKLKGTMIRVLVENNFDHDNFCHMAIKVFRSTFTTAMCKCTIITLLDDSNLNAFQTFWPRLNILHLVDVPKIIDDVIFVQKTRECHFQTFHSTNKFTNSAHAMWLPTCCCLCHINFRWFL